MPDLISRAIHFATQAHQRIDHKRKYSGQPYSVHLEQVAKIVNSVTDDPEMIAVAWLHDSVEDTPATYEDIERAFGVTIASMVRELTDISKPGDGNRNFRKSMDREHLAHASARSQTIKLADLIDNCNDIAQHDARFARVYLNEMELLLEVLTRADDGLMRRARKVMSKSVAQISKAKFNEENPLAVSSAVIEGYGTHFKQQYNGIFTAKDIAEPLFSFDAETTIYQAKTSLRKYHHQVVGVRVDGKVTGYIDHSYLDADGFCGTVSRTFSPDQVLSGDAGLVEVIHVLTRHDYCFVSLLGEIHGVIDREDINKPYARMWLLGIITLTEMRMTELIKKYCGNGRWQDLIPQSRLKAALDLQAERARRNQHSDLIDCLQLADKGQIFVGSSELFPLIGFSSKSATKKVIKQFQSLRNNLAHMQDISTYDWAHIARMTMQMLDE